MVAGDKYHEQSEAVCKSIALTRPCSNADKLKVYDLRTAVCNVQQASICLVHPQQGAHTVASKGTPASYVLCQDIPVQYQVCRGTAALPLRRKPVPLSVVCKLDSLFKSLRHTSLKLPAGFIGTWAEEGQNSITRPNPPGMRRPLKTRQHLKGQAARLCPRKNPDTSAAHLSPQYEHHEALIDSPYVRQRDL